MTFKNVKNIALFSFVAIFAVMSVGISNANAEEDSGYQMVGDVTPVLTFTFREGVETYEFPVFNMSEDLIDNRGTGFSVEGIVTDAPLLHKALDEAYKYRLVRTGGLDYHMKYFDVVADFVKNGESVQSLDYYNCIVKNYQIETLDSNDYESYFAKVGFAVVDKIDFECSGVDLGLEEIKPHSTSTYFMDHGESGFKYANNVRASTTFLFDEGTEKIEFPVFDLDSAYAESSSRNVDVEFTVEGVLGDYPLLYNTVAKSRSVSGIGSASNNDFDVVADFTDGKNTLREMNFNDCLVKDAQILTKTDKEEGFTGKSGFVIVNTFGFECAGLNSTSSTDVLIGDSSKNFHAYEEPLKNSTNELKTVVTMTHPYGIETIEFSMFKQNEVLNINEDLPTDKKNSNANEFTRKPPYPTIELRGILGDYPLLYKHVDDNRKIQGVGGTQQKSLVDIDVSIVKGDETLRGFDYVKCRTINYDIDTNPNTEESYVKDKFAVENIFTFECQGYHPNNPAYDAMLKNYEKAKTVTSNDLRNTDQWGPGFFIEKDTESTD